MYIEFRVHGFGASGLGLKVLVCVGFRVSGLGFRAQKGQKDMETLIGVYCLGDDQEKLKRVCFVSFFFWFWASGLRV